MWMYFESRSFQYDKSDVSGLAAMRPRGWFFSALFLWIIAFPLYLASRAKLKTAGETRRARLMSEERYVAKPQSNVGPVLVGVTGAFLILCMLAPTNDAVSANAGVGMASQDVELASAVQQALPKRDPNIISDGIYEVGSEFAPGLYRVGQYWERQDSGQGIIANDLTHGGCPTLMLVRQSDSYVKIRGEAIPAHLRTIDPIANECSGGTFLVGPDIAPGRYRIKSGGRPAYWERLNSKLETIDNELGNGQLILVVRSRDFAVKLSGVGSIERMGG